MIVVILSFLQSIVMISKTFASLFNLVKLLKAVHNFWTTEGRKKYSFALRLWLSLIMLLHFVALSAALGVILGLTVIAAPIVTAIVNVTSLIKSLASLIFYSYHEVTYHRKFKQLTAHLESHNIKFSQNLNFFEEIKLCFKKTASLEAKIVELKEILATLEAINESTLLNQFEFGLKKKIYEAIELDDLILLHLQNIDNKKEKLKALIKDLEIEINQLKQDIEQKQHSMLLLKMLPQRIALNDDVTSLQKEIETSDTYQTKLESLLLHFKKINHDIYQLELLILNLNEKQASADPAQKQQIQILENKIQSMLKPVSRTRANRFFNSMVNSFKDIHLNFQNDKLSLIRLLKNEITCLSKELLSLNLKINDKWQNRLTYTTKNQNGSSTTTSSDIYYLTQQILRLKKQKDLAEIEKNKEMRSVVLGVLLTVNAIFLCLTVNWIAIGILSLSMFSLTALSVFKDIVWFFKMKQAENNANAKEHSELRAIRRNKFDELEKIEIPNIEETLQKKLNKAIQIIDENQIENEITQEYQSNIDYFILNNSKGHGQTQAKNSSNTFRKASFNI
ncbi:MAG: hypothetical protein JSS07_00040 [Proteobacteria bacterium]|nr:hypothetical protein [Pseudomonadota bacterium]